MVPLQEAELAGAPDGLVTDTGKSCSEVLQEKRIDLQKKSGLGCGAGTTCFTGKVFFCQGREMGKLLLSIWHPGDKGEKDGRTRSLQPSLVPVSCKVRAGRHRDGLGFN